MPGAALAAAERPQEQEKQDGPLQHAAPVRPQYIFASAQGTLPRTHPQRDCMRSGHKLKYIVIRYYFGALPFEKGNCRQGAGWVILAKLRPG
jgi:hypothetical protein